MDLVKLKVRNIKNIKSADIELPMEGGVYSLVGGNGSGKSTLMLLLSVIVSSRRYSMLQLEDFDYDTLILGCTHFPYIQEELEKISKIEILDPAAKMLEMLLN